VCFLPPQRFHAFFFDLLSSIVSGGFSDENDLWCFFMNWRTRPLFWPLFEYVFTLFFESKPVDASRSFSGVDQDVISEPLSLRLSRHAFILSRCLRGRAASVVGIPFFVGSFGSIFFFLCFSPFKLPFSSYSITQGYI